MFSCGLPCFFCEFTMIIFVCVVYYASFCGCLRCSLWCLTFFVIPRLLVVFYDVFCVFYVCFFLLVVVGSGRWLTSVYICI